MSKGRWSLATTIDLTVLALFNTAGFPSGIFSPGAALMDNRMELAKCSRAGVGAVDFLFFI